MRNKTVPVLSKQFLGYAVKTKSWHPVERNGWLIKFSIYKNENILLTIVSRYTAQTIIRYFTNEDEACKFINYIVSIDADTEVDV
jgi:hypothetical protein